jgi:hypothetical protein
VWWVPSTLAPKTSTTQVGVATSAAWGGGHPGEGGNVCVVGQRNPGPKDVNNSGGCKLSQGMGTQSGVCMVGWGRAGV